jgi:hypothetical protein
MDDFPQGNDLPAYVTAKFEELTKRWWPEHVQKAVQSAGCDVEDHQRGLRSWANLGAETIVVPVKGSDPTVADHYPIRERTLSALDEQIRQLVNALRHDIEGHLADN